MRVAFAQIEQRLDCFQRVKDLIWQRYPSGSLSVQSSSLVAEPLEPKQSVPIENKEPRGPLAAGKDFSGKAFS
jgi:hypothetical protein